MLNQSGEEVGRLVDMVAQVHGSTDPYPALTGIRGPGGAPPGLPRLRPRSTSVERRSVTLRTARLDLREFHRREGEVLLHRDILDHQLVDTDEVQVIRAADLYLAQVGDQVRLVGVDVSLQTLLRRLGPKRFRWHPTPDRVIDWAAIESFGADSPEAPRRDEAARAALGAAAALRPPSSRTCWKSWAGRAGRSCWPASTTTSPRMSWRRWSRTELTALLREVEPAQAAELVARMEPDEAVDALRDLPEPSRHSFWPRCQRPPSGNSPACSATPKTRPRAS